MVCGANGILELAVICNCCKDKGSMKDNYIHLNNKIAHDLQKQEHAMAAKSNKGSIRESHVPKK